MDFLKLCLQGLCRLGVVTDLFGHGFIVRFERCIVHDHMGGIHRKGAIIGQFLCDGLDVQLAAVNRGILRHHAVDDQAVRHTGSGDSIRRPDELSGSVPQIVGEVPRGVLADLHPDSAVLILDLHGCAVDGKSTIFGANLDKVGIDHRGCDIPGHEVIHHRLCDCGVLDHDVVTGQVDRLQRTHTGIACEEVFDVAGCRLQVFDIRIGGVQVFDSGLLCHEPSDLSVRSLQILNLGCGGIQICHVRFLGDQAVDLGQLRVQGTDIGVGRLQLVRHHMLKGGKVL